jgi:hypothetical protein
MLVQLNARRVMPGVRTGLKLQPEGSEASLRLHQGRSNKQLKLTANRVAIIRKVDAWYIVCAAA